MIFEHMYFLLGTSCILLKTEMPLGLCIWKHLKCITDCLIKEIEISQHQEIMSENETAYDHHHFKNNCSSSSDSSWKLLIFFECMYVLPQNLRHATVNWRKLLCSTSSIKTCPHFPLVLKIDLYIFQLCLKHFYLYLIALEKKKKKRCGGEWEEILWEIS